MNTTASMPFFAAPNSTGRVSKSVSRSHNPVVQALEVVVGTASIAVGVVAVLGVVHALIALA